MSKKSFVQGAAVLAVAGLLVKFLGAVFRIPLANMLGDVGMGYYQPAYYIYNLFLVLATAGIPVAISRMVSERYSFGQYYEAQRVFKISRMLMIAIGAASFLIVFFGAEIFVPKNVPEAVLAVRAISPALILVPLMASYRGYFQGQQDMTPTAVSQFIEQVFRVGVGLFLAYTMFHTVYTRIGATPEEAGAAGATLGAVAGSIGGLIVMLIVYYRQRGRLKKQIADERHSHKIKRESSKSILKQIVVIAIPITIGATVMPIVNIIDTAVVTNRLVATGWEQTVAVGMYGQLASFCGALVNFPQVLTQAVAMSLVPLVAAAWKQKDMNHLRTNVESGLRMAVILGMPCAMGLFVLAEPILLLLYASQKAAAISAAPCLMVLSIGVVFLAIVQTLTGVLQGVGKQMIPVRNLVIAVIFKIAITWILTGIHSVNILGAATGTVVAYAIAATLDIIAVKKYTGTHFSFMKTAVKPFISCAVMGIGTWGSYQLLFNLLDGSRLATVGAILIAVVIYAVMIFVTKTITREDLVNLPKGTKLVKIYDKFVK